MNIVLKTTLKNIFGKPFRTLLVVFSIFMCSFVAMFCFDFGAAEKNLIMDLYSKIGGNANLVLTATAEDTSRIPADFPEHDEVVLRYFSDMIYCDIEGEPMYATQKDLSVYGMDFEAAERMEMIAHYELEDGHTILTDKAAEDMGVEVGDTVILHDNHGDDHEFIVSQIVESDPMSLLLNGDSALITENDAQILSCGKPGSIMVMIDLADDNQAEQAQMMLEEAYPTGSVQNFAMDESIQEALGQILGVMFLVFAVTFLLVVFVTASICDRIVGERMSFVGTLRSLGMDSRGTGLILLLENLLYAVIGSIPAVFVYSAIRAGMYAAMLTGTTSDGQAVAFDTPSMSALLPIGVIVGAVAIECFIPLRAITRALRISIRDIIFDNRDTEYKFNRTTLIFGLICLAVSVPTFFLRKNIFFATTCLVAAVAALAFLFPRILKLVTTGIKKVADKFEKSTWSLASVEAISRKSTVGSGVLCATAAAMCIVVYALTGGLTDSINVVPYNCDVVMETTKENKYYTYIEHLDGVTDSETLYTALKLITVNDETKEGYGYYFGMPDGGFKYYEGFKGLPDKIEEGCVCLDKSFASRKGIKAGDTIKITINPESVFPVVREYKVTNIVECNNNGYSGESIVVSEAEYKFLFRDTPGEILIKCEDPDAIKKTLETYAKGNYNKVETFDEKVENLNSSNSKTIAVVTAIIIVALGMTAIGMISNQLIGFEGRKKECAVMLSTAMNKSKLSGILLKEVLITSTTASAAGTIVGTILTFVLKTAMASAQTLVMDINVNPLHNLLFFVIMSVVFTATVLFPIKNLRKMKIAEQIKYE